MDNPSWDDVSVLARLNDLLQLECDALPTYTLAILSLRDPDYRDALRAFRADHERHFRDLVATIRERGGIPLRLPHMPTGLFKLAVQAAGAPGGDRAVLMAFKSNELQSKEKYARLAAAPNPPPVADLLRRNAEDEARHYEWVSKTLDELGVGAGSMAGIANNAFAMVHGAVADTVEAVGRMGLEAVGRMMRPGS